MTNRLLTAVFCSACLILSGTTAHAGDIDPGLREILKDAGPHEVISTLVYLWDQGEVDELTAQLRTEQADRATRHREVALRLRSTADVTQRQLVRRLEQLHAQAKVERFESFWIANVIRVDATPAVIESIARHRDVLTVYYNMPIQSVMPVEDEQMDGNENQAQSTTSGSSPEPGIVAVRAPEVWNELGYTGEGIVVATLDTGVDGNHPALASRWRGLHPDYQGNPEWAWFDPVTNTTFPQEFQMFSHGTHTMGSVVGGAPGDAIGVAPGAEWIHAAVIDRVNITTTVADAIEAYQWMVAPTGDPEDTWAVPHVCSNSWGLLSGHGYPNCDDTLWSFIDNSEAAGTVQLFSAGNESSNGLRRPADRATDEFRNVAVAAIDPHNSSWPVWSSSSQGPTFCTLDGSEAIKPDIAAPGVSIRSSLSGGGYGQKNGTSMASPHINGVVALMLEACAELTVEEVKQIIYDTAVDLGTLGKNNVYGYGMVDAYEAVLAAEAMCGGSGSCAGDVLQTGTINVDDLVAVLNAWGPCFGCAEDINSDGEVNVDDLLILLNNWGPCE